MTELLFRDDAYLRECRARVTAVHSDDDGLRWVALDRTVFYPLGGGQPGDTGVFETEVGELRIEDTRKGEAGEVLHRLAEDQAPPRVGVQLRAVLDWERRYAHMRMHTAMHLLGVALPFPVTGGSVGAERSRLDFDMQDTVDKVAVAGAVNALIAADHPVGTRWITDAELDAQPVLVRTMSVQPPRGAGRVRLLAIGDPDAPELVDLQPCGGTHVARTGEIGAIAVAKVEKKGKRNRRVALVFA